MPTATQSTRELIVTAPEHRLSLSTGYPFPHLEIDELRGRLDTAGLNLSQIFKTIKMRETFANFEAYSPELIAKLRDVCKVLPVLGDLFELYDPNWALCMHVVKFITSLFFSRGNEENGFPLGEGMNGKSWLMFVLDQLLGGYSCCVQAGVYGQPVPSTPTPNPDWLALMGKKAFLGGEKGTDLKIDAGTFKALRDPTNVIELRGIACNPKVTRK